MNVCHRFQDRGRANRKRQDAQRKAAIAAQQKAMAATAVPLGQAAPSGAEAESQEEVLGKIKAKLKQTLYDANEVAPSQDEVVLHEAGFKER